MGARDLADDTRHIVLGGLELEGLCRAFDALLRERVGYAVAAWSTLDPATCLFTSCTMTGVDKDPAREAALFQHEFRADEPATFAELIATGQTVAVLSEVTGGELERAGRFRDLLSAFGVSDELRAVLWADGVAWGSATLYRLEGRFTAAEAARVAAAAPRAGHGMRLALLRTATIRPEAVLDPPGVLEVSADGHVTALTVPARRWLALGGPQLVTAANTTAAAVRGRTWPGAGARLPLASGHVLSLHAASMAGTDGAVAVIVDAARPPELGQMLVHAYGLTRRQREVLALLLQGHSMIQIAHRLGISEHTAHDHRKAIYRRVGVSSRSELAGILQSEHYDPQTHLGTPPSPYGGFLAN